MKCISTDTEPQTLVAERPSPDELSRILNNPNFRPRDLISFLKRSENLSGLYAGQTGVWEGYTLEEHTLMVQGQYERYFAPNWQNSLIDRNLFRVMLALHDIGKPAAIGKGLPGSAQHEHTRRLIPGILQHLGMDEAQTKIILAVVTHDILGGYLRNRLTPAQTIAGIRKEAAMANISAQSLLGVIETYYMCDAGSYTRDAGGKTSLDSLFIFDRENSRMSLNPEYQKKMEILKELIGRR